MDDVLSTLLKDLSGKHPGHFDLLQTLCSFLQADAVPGFIHVHAPTSTKHSQQVVQTLLQRISEITPLLYLCLNGIDCFSSRSFYRHVLHALSTQCQSKPGGLEGFIPLEDIQPYTSDLDNFLRALRLISKKSSATILIVIDRAEKFKEFLPDLWTPLSRLDELAGVPVSVTTLSQASWFELRPLDGSAIEPLLINVKPYNKKNSQTFLTALFPSRPGALLSPYNPAFRPLFTHFISTVVNICFVFLVDESELAYIASACWPIFVQPIINQWRQQTQQSPNSQLVIPDEDARIRLTKYFTPLIAHALEMLYPRIQHITQWIRENSVSEDTTLSDILQTASVYQIKAENPSQQSRMPDNRREYCVPPHIRSLTTIAKYILIAAFLASHNPHKSDLKLFGRSISEKGKRRKGGGTARVRAAVGPRGKTKVPQKLLGPMAFPLDRLLAIVGSLMEEHYLEQENEDPMRSDNSDQGDDLNNDHKDIEMVVGRVQLSATITELANQGLLNRVAPEKADLDVMTYKSTIDQPCAFSLAREVGIGSLVDYMYNAEG